MAKTIEEVVIKTKVEGANDINGLKKSINDLKADIAGAGQVGGAFGNTINGIVGKLGPLGLAAAAAGAAMVALASHGLKTADALNDISAATGISAGVLMNFKSSLVQAGGSMDSFEKFATKLSNSVADAADGNSKLKDTFRTLGVNTVDASGNLRDIDDIMADVTASLAGMTNKTERQRIATELMGKEAARIDWSNVKAGRDAITDAQVAALDRYKAAVDELKTGIDRLGLSFAGNLAIGINKATDAIGKFFREQKAAIREDLGLSRINIGPSDAGGGRGTSQFAANDPRRIKGEGAAGRVAEEELKASNKRIEDANANYSLSVALQTRDEKIKIAAQQAAEIAKITAEVNANEKLKGPEGAAQREAEIAARTTAVNAKAALELYNLEARITDQLAASNLQYKQLVENFSRGNIEADHQLAIQLRGTGLGRDNLEMYIQQEAILTKSRLQVIALQQEAEKVRLTLGIDPTAESRLAQIEQAIRNVEQQTGIALETNKKSVAGLQEIRNSEEAYQFALGLTNQAQLNAITAKSELIGLTATENEKIIQAIELQKQLAIAQKLQEEQAKLGRKDGELVPIKPERIAEITKQVSELYDKQGKQTQEQIDKSREFGVGWEKAYKQYVENATNAAEQARTMFSTVTRSFEDAIVNFVKTGKLSFKDFANSVIEQFVRIQAQKLALGIFGDGKSAGGFIGSLLGLPGRASGGPVDAMTPYMVGEKGPELFVPRSAGNIVPNHSLGGGSNVTYNINAVDASSFRQLVASDPEFLYAVTEKGRSSIPSRR
jgi:lambda family phage tail tape measure protein